MLTEEEFNIVKMMFIREANNNLRDKKRLKLYLVLIAKLLVMI